MFYTCFIMFFFRDKADERATCVNSIHHYYLRSPSNIQFSMDPMTDQWLPTSSTSSPMMLGKYKPQPMHLQQWSSTGKSFNQKPSEAWGSFPLATFHQWHESHITLEWFALWSQQPVGKHFSCPQRQGNFLAMIVGRNGMLSRQKPLWQSGSSTLPRHDWWAVPPQGWYPFEMG